MSERREEKRLHFMTLNRYEAETVQNTWTQKEREREIFVLPLSPAKCVCVCSLVHSWFHFSGLSDLGDEMIERESGREGEKFNLILYTLQVSLSFFAIASLKSASTEPPFQVSLSPLIYGPLHRGPRPKSLSLSHSLQHKSCNQWVLCATAANIHVSFVDN